MKKHMTKSKSGFLLLAGVLVLTFCCFGTKISAAEKTYATKGDVVAAVNKLLGAKAKAPAVTASDVKENSKYYKDMSIAIRAGIISPDKNNKLQPEKQATSNYIANLLSRATGLSVKEILESKDLKKHMTKKELTAFIKKIVPNVIYSDTQKVKKGTVVINKPDVKLSNLNITGNLVVGDGVSDGTITLENVVVNGKTYIRGGGEHSIYVEGNSKLPDVKVKQVYNQVRLKVSETAVVTSLTIKDGCDDVICEGNYTNITAKNAGHGLKLNNASIDSLVIAQRNISIQTEGKTNVNTAIIKPNASDLEMKLEQGTTVNKLDIYGTDAKLEGQGHIKSINNSANNSSINVPCSQIDTKDGITGTVINGKPSDKKDSDNSGSNSSSSNSNSSSSGSNSPSYSDVQITGVYAKPGVVEVILNKAVPLTQDSFYISCPAGKDMTILKSETAEGADKNKIYQLSTAFYADNTYLLTITLPNGKKIEKEFITNSSIPVLSNIYTERKTATEAEFSFTADDSGILYYMVVPLSSTGKSNLGMDLFSLISSKVPQSGEEIKNNGEMLDIHAGLNTIQINTLTKDTAYSIYYAEAFANSGTPIIQPPVQINAEPLITNPSDITIEECIGINDQTISVKLNKPTKAPLELNAFSVSCPAGSIMIGRVETTDCQTYTLYLPQSDHMSSKNTYTIIINFQDNTSAKGSFYGDFVWPTIPSVNIKHVTDSAIQVIFNSDEKGILHYVISDEEIKTAAEVLAHPSVKTADIFAGANKLMIHDFPEGGNRKYFSFVQEDIAGNQAGFSTRGAIPVDITPLVSSALNSIETLTTSTSQGIDGKNSTNINITLFNSENLNSLDLKYDITIYTFSGGSQFEPRVITLRCTDNPNSNGKQFWLSLNTELPTGQYQLEMKLPSSSDTVTKDFVIE